MNIIYSDQSAYGNAHPSMFLAGPTPRDESTPSWRPEALRILKELNYKGTVFVPEYSIRQEQVDYLKQVEWEDAALNSALYQVFWVPRNLITLPAFTTNIEFGRFAHLPSCLYGRPDDSEKNQYLDWYYTKYNNHPIYNSLTDLLKRATL